MRVISPTFDPNDRGNNDYRKYKISLDKKIAILAMENESLTSLLTRAKVKVNSN